MNEYSCLLMGANTRLIACGDILLRNGHRIVGVVSSEPSVRGWAEENNLRPISPLGDLLTALEREPFDLFFSIDNVWKVPSGVLKMARRLSINFHDAPLPKYAGMNATNWAIMNREFDHGVTWHVMADQIDAGDILKTVVFPLARDETAMSLNAKCYEKSIEAFAALVDELSEGRAERRPQNLEERTYFARWKRPVAACTVDFSLCAEEIDALVRALDYGTYPNPLGLPKLYLGDEAVIVRRARVSPERSLDLPGAILAVDKDGMMVSTSSQDLELTELCLPDGQPFGASELLEQKGLRVGDRLPSLGHDLGAAVTRVYETVCRHEDFWSPRLLDLEVVELPYKKAEPSSGQAPQFLELRHVQAAAVSATSATGRSPADVVLSAFLLYVHRLCGKDTFDVYYRDAELARLLSGTEAYFASHVPVRFDFRGIRGPEQLVSQVERQIAEAAAHGSYARDLVLRTPSLRKVLKQAGRLALPLVVERAERLPEHAPTVEAEIVLIIEDRSGDTAWWYDARLFEREQVRRMQEQFVDLMNRLSEGRARSFGELPITTEEERGRLSVWNDTRTDYPRDLLLHQLFEAQAVRTPDAVAVSFEDRRLTYRELDGRANRLANHLRSLGVGTDILVGVCMERSLEMVVALYATLKAGGAYVPIDPEYPADRVAYMLSDAEPAVLLTQGGVADRLSLPRKDLLCLDTGWERIAAGSRSKPPETATPSSLAYMIYTSGSTGRPKGALNTHAAICNRLLWMQDHFRLTSSDRVLQKTPFSFDVSVWEFFWPLLNGAQLVVARPGGHRDAEYLVRAIKEQQITVLHFVPSMLRAFLEEPGAQECLSVRDVICSGEALHYDLQEEFFRLLPARLSNLYGPTEAAVDVTYWTCESDSTRRVVPIGRPVANTQIRILDRYMSEVPPGVAGEIYIGGIQVGQGYHHRPELTSERFIPDPFGSDPEARLYKTGDLGRWLEDGTIEYLGRTDFQVKIRGLRVELNEIEAVAGEYPEVQNCAVMALESAGGGKRLVGYVEWKARRQPDEEGLRSHLRRALPDYMVPSLLLTMDEFPLTPSGKVDRRALPVPQEDALATAGPRYVEPADQTERKIAAVWQEVLGISRVGAASNFFDLGGDSLGLIRVRSRLQRVLDRDVALLDLFSYPTIGALARHLSGDSNDTVAQRPVEAQLQSRRAGAARRRELRKSIIHDSRVGTDEQDS